ncbi:hypothetical protein LTR56_011587 [Elasticomyces elasticus]|nr:hypothetical protein LTR56_011587 [Elasticomyces elasticus]KAK3656984.1 hypothetical protein LTR22_009485 [Elasticomyces elasticus]KAK4916207.1 hypothetical protein LTR49_015712 [Elasticomyces elasticus]KAK5764256.1 hypothetical protein LTS12_005707 [Elasticomyces elasticus]
MATSAIPPFYRTFFQTIDPTIASTGFITALGFPGFLLRTYTPTATLPPAIETTMALDSLSGFYLSIIVLQVFLLRAKPQDLTVWRLLQFSILITDVVMCGGTARALNAQGRLNPADWRFEEVGTLAITVGVGLIRTAFLLGLGLSDAAGSVKKKEV